MANNKDSIGLLIQQCHKLRQKRKQCLDMAKQTLDLIEKERLIQTAEHYGRSVQTQQSIIDLKSNSREQ